MEENIMTTSPAVFAVGKEYQIMLPVNCSCTMKVVCGDKVFYDHSNGALRSEAKVHRVKVPVSLLDKEKRYKIILRRMKNRKPYFPESFDEEEFEYPFYPASGEKLKAFMIADSHGKAELPSEAAKKAGKIDLLILNGDIPNHTNDFENILTVYRIAEKVTGGMIPCIFSRGNHDARGIMAENYEQCTPTENGRPYYTVHLGKVWFMILDCGEDKNDDHPEYGNTAACHVFRLEETEYLENIIKNSSEEYNSPEIKQKAVICHIPFSKRFPAPFDIEENVYTYWMKLLSEEVKPDIMLCGHKHVCEYHEPHGEYDDFGQCCPIIIGAKPEKDLFTGTYLEFDSENGEISFEFVDSCGKRYGKKTVKVN